MNDLKEKRVKIQKIEEIIPAQGTLAIVNDPQSVEAFAKRTQINTWTHSMWWFSLNGTVARCVTQTSSENDETDKYCIFFYFNIFVSMLTAHKLKQFLYEANRKEEEKNTIFFYFFFLSFIHSIQSFRSLLFCFGFLSTKVNSVIFIVVVATDSTTTKVRTNFYFFFAFSFVSHSQCNNTKFWLHLLTSVFFAPSSNVVRTFCFYYF